MPKLIQVFAMLRMESLGQREIQKNNDVYRVSQAAKKRWPA